nr:MAG TPA: Plasmid recombination enzyme [Caudoviricetes sp.]
MTKTITMTSQRVAVTPTQATHWSNHSRNKKRLEVEEHRNTFIDPERTPDNVTVLDTIGDKTIAEWVDEVYAEDVLDYNSKKEDQRPERMLERFSDKLHHDKRQPKPYNEFVFSYGKSSDLTKDGLPYFSTEGVKLNQGERNIWDNLDIGGKEWNTRRDALVDFAQQLPDLLPHMRFSYITVHLDETNPHIHAGAVGYTPVEQTGKRPQMAHTPSISKAMRKTAIDAGYQPAKNRKGDPIDTDANRWVMDEMLKGHMLSTYNKHSEEKTKRAPKQTKKPPLDMQYAKQLLQPINQLAQELASMRDKMAGAIETLSDAREELPEELQEAVDVLESVRDGQLLGQVFDIVKMTESDTLYLNGILTAREYELDASQRQHSDDNPDGTNYDDLINDLMDGYDFDELTQ